MSEPTHLIAIGASAGGLEAIESFFQSMPHDSGMAFVVVQHLSPDFKSLMNEILVRFTEMKIFRVEEGMSLQRNCIYLIPAGKQMVIRKSGFHLTERAGSALPEQTISIFFESVAQVWKERAIGIVLSGSGSDGSRGLAEISESGGLSIVQSPQEAKFDAMPLASLATGRVDLVRDAGAMRDAILLFAQSPDDARQLDVKQPAEEAKDDLERILELLNENFGTDFSDYKPGTVNRRIERRTSIHHRISLTEYREMLESDPEELNLLYKDLLIGVTHFFRDPESFKMMQETVIPELFDRLDTNEELRVWVPGCATGEEVYSLAILLEEYRRENSVRRSWKIFATDIHSESLDWASRGVYSPSQVSEVSKERLKTYFTRSGDNYRIIRSLRDDVVFATHNVLRDPPFTRVHLISCRNLLIYFSNAAQQRVIGVFSFALQIRGILFLGGSESLGEIARDFEDVGRKERIFRKVRASTRNRVDAFRARSREEKTKTFASRDDEPTFATMEALISAHVESGVLLNVANEVLYSLGETREFLRPPVGRASNQFLDMVPDDLRMTVSGAIHQARRKNEKVTFVSDHEFHSEDVSISIVVTPVNPPGAVEEFLFVTLSRVEKEESALRRSRSSSDPELAGLREEGSFAQERIEELESELKLSQEGMQNAVEELETSNEELQSTNEELVASNEELQSTNEELQSVNEELYTVNAEFDAKNRELAALNSDLDNLLESTRIGVVFLDADMRIRKFTPAAAETVHLMESDVGRPLSHITNNLRLDSDDLFEMAESVVKKQCSVEREVKTRDNVWYLMRILPFYDSEGDMDGVVVSFININQIKVAQAERELESQRQLVIMESVDTMVWLHLDHYGHCNEVQPAWEKFQGQEWPDYEGMGWTSSIHDSERAAIKAEIEEGIRNREKFQVDSFRVMHQRSGDFRPCELSFWPIDPGENDTGWVACLNDISESEKARSEIAHQKSLLESIVNNSDAAISVKDKQKKFILLNRFMAELLGCENTSEMLGRSIEDGELSSLAAQINEHDDYVLETGRSRMFEAFIDPSNPEVPYNITKFPLRSPGGMIEGVVGIATDLSDRERQVQLRQQTDELSRVNKELALRNQELDDYAYIISHDLKQPLRTIFGMADMLRAEVGDQLEGDAAHFLDRIGVASHRLREMVDAILDYSRSAREEIEWVPCDIADIINEVIENLSAEVDAKGVEIELSDSFPVIQADGMMIHQVFQNLIGNALKFSNEENPVIAVRWEADEPHFTFSVEDNGIGIPEEFRTKVFNPFERLHSADAYPGTGIGLALVARLVHRHGGEVYAEDTETGKGIRFRFLIPKVEGNNEALEE